LYGVIGCSGLSAPVGFAMKQQKDRKMSEGTTYNITAPAVRIIERMTEHGPEVKKEFATVADYVAYKDYRARNEPQSTSRSHGSVKSDGATPAHP
jgi:hypothetical protein